MTNDLQGPDLARYLLHRRLDASMGVLSIDEMDAKLKEKGITDGGQLSSMSTRELGELLNAEGLLYGELQEFKNMNLGVMHQRKVKINLTLVNAKSGEKIWENSQKSSGSKIALDKREAAEILVEGYAEKIGEMMTKNPLRWETQDTVDALVQDLEVKAGRSMFIPRRVRNKDNSDGLIKKGFQKWMKGAK